MGAFKLHFNQIIFPEAKYIPISYYEKQWQTKQGFWMQMRLTSKKLYWTIQNTILRSAYQFNRHVYIKENNNGVLKLCRCFVSLILGLKFYRF